MRREFFNIFKTKEIMNQLKTLKYETEMTENFSGVMAVTNSLLSASCNPIIIPFTKDDLHRLYDYFRAALR